MIVAGPMGFVRTVIFFPTFIISRIPFWFIIASLIFNPLLSLGHVILIVTAIFIAKSFIESEIAGGGFFLFTFMRLARFIAGIIFIIAVDLFFIFYIFADPIDKALISATLIVATLLFFDYEVQNGYWNGYRLPMATNIILTFLWLYLLMIQDTVFGYITIISAIYLIEFFHLYFTNVINGLEDFEYR